MIKFPYVRRLICVAGPPAVGKTSLLRAAKGEAAELLGPLLGVEDLSTTPSFAAGWVPKGFVGAELAMFHYDFLRVWKFGGGSLNIAADPGAVPILGAQDLFVVTLVADPQILLRRFRERPVLDGASVRASLMRPRSMAGSYVSRFRTTRLYRNPERLLAIYGEWVRFVESRQPRAHIFVDCTTDLHEVSFPAWSDSISSRYIGPNF
jgi:hypothetical protein